MKTPELINFLKKRRSSKIAYLADPAPSHEDIQTILEIGARVPDHGKYNPWYFIVFQGDARIEAGKLLREAYHHEHPEAEPAKLDLEAEKFLRAPLVIAVVSRIREGKHPQWEQILSAGAACYNIGLAAQGLGYGCNWLSEWYSYSPKFRELLGLDRQDHFAGFLYIGTETTKNDERPRPDLNQIVTYWSKNGQTLHKGNDYGMPGKGFPPAQVTNIIT